jgi:uncharacterized lipoprotein YmbA
MALSRRLALGTLAGLAACRSPDPILYTIQPVPGTPRQGGPRSVTLREVSLARYLDRLQIVRASRDYRLDLATNEWWGEPLDAMLTRVTVENLTQRLPGSSVFASGGAISAPGAAVVEINLQRLGMAGPDQLTLTAQIAVDRREERRRATTRTETLTVPVRDGTTPAFAAAASEAMGRLSDAIAGLLTG